MISDLTNFVLAFRDDDFPNLYAQPASVFGSCVRLPRVLLGRGSPHVVVIGTRPVFDVVSVHVHWHAVRGCRPS